jgi:predicted lactoylglutathione lyase
MSKMIFVNLPIADVVRSREFFGGLGYTFNEQFSDEKALCLVISDTIFAMLVKPEYLNTFLDKPVGDPKQAVTAILSLTFDSREELATHCEKAFSLGARNYKEPVDMGFMFQWGYEDLDGNIWEGFWMDPNAVMPTE